MTLTASTLLQIQSAIRTHVERKPSSTSRGSLLRTSSSSSSLSGSRSPLPDPGLVNLCNDFPSAAFPDFDLPTNISELNFETMGTWWATKLAELESVFYDVNLALYDSNVSDKLFVRSLLYMANPSLPTGTQYEELKAREDHAIYVSYLNRYLVLLNDELKGSGLDAKGIGQFIFSLKQYAVNPRRNILLTLKYTGMDFSARSSRMFDFCTDGFPGVSSDFPEDLLALTEAQLKASEIARSTAKDLDSNGEWTDWFEQRIVEIVDFLYSTDAVTKDTLLREVFEKSKRAGEEFSLATQTMLVKGCFLAFSGTIRIGINSACPKDLDPKLDFDKHMRWKTGVNVLLQKLLGHADAFYPQIRRALLRKDKEMALNIGAKATYEEELKLLIEDKIKAEPAIEMEALLEYVYVLLYSDDGPSSKFWIQGLLEKSMCYEKKDGTLYSFNNKYEANYFSLIIGHVVEAEKLRRSIKDNQLENIKDAFLEAKKEQHKRKAMEELVKISDISSSLLGLVDQIDLKPDDRISVEQSFQTVQVEVVKAYGKGRWLSPAEKQQLLENTVKIAKFSKDMTAQYSPREKGFIRSIVDAFYKALKEIFFAQTPQELKVELSVGASKSTSRTRTRRGTTVSPPPWLQHLYRDRKSQYIAGFQEVISSNAPPPRPLPFVSSIA